MQGLTELKAWTASGDGTTHKGVNVEPEVYARQQVNRLHRFEREPMPESAE
jgi:hypothetical protein